MASGIQTQTCAAYLFVKDLLLTTTPAGLCCLSLDETHKPLCFVLYKRYFKCFGIRANCLMLWRKLRFWVSSSVLFLFETCLTTTPAGLLQVAVPFLGCIVEYDDKNFNELKVNLNTRLQILNTTQDTNEITEYNTKTNQCLCADWC